MDRGDIEALGEPIWQTGNFDLTFEISKENEKQLNLTVPLEGEFQNLYKNNQTLWLHF